MIKFILFIVVLLTSLNTFAQKNSYFYNQKNTFSVNLSMNPRLVPMSKNQKMAKEGGTYFQKYDKNNNLQKGDEKVNLMLNVSYGRLFGGNKIIGVEFNYQKHYLTANRKLFIDTLDVNEGYGYNELGIPALSSSPVFNIYDFNIFYGRFSDAVLSPNKHLIQYGLGVRIHSLNKNQNYRLDSSTPITDLNDFVGNPDKNYLTFRLTFSYTYRILLTKNLNLDLGVLTNLALAFRSRENFSYDGNSPIYDEYYVGSKLRFETMMNMFYFKSGLSFDF